jgi:hypothetical protein
VESQVNEHWPLMSTVKSNGYAGIQITPRWASNMYYNVSSEHPCFVVDSDELVNVIGRLYCGRMDSDFCRKRQYFCAVEP